MSNRDSRRGSPWHRRAALLAALTLPLFAGAAAALSADGAALDEREMSRGRILFLQCRACHAVESADSAGKLGPSLHGVFGRAAGTAAGYTGYSEALRGSGVVWDRQSMDRWLTDPAEFVPGTLMAFPGIADDANRALLVRYLEQVTAADPP